MPVYSIVAKNRDATCDLSTDLLSEPWVVLRRVNRESVEYLELRDSISAGGFFNSLCVRPLDGGRYEIVDGMYRWTCAKELGLETVPCIIKYGMSQADVLAAQIQANAIRPETTVAEFARQIRRVMESLPGCTMGHVGKILSKSPHWVSQMLSLSHLAPGVLKALDRGQISLGAACQLARLPAHGQRHYVDAAMSMTLAEFREAVSACVKQAKEEAHQGRRLELYAENFKPVAYLRPVKELKTEGVTNDARTLILTREDCQTTADAWRLCLEWVLHLDKDSINEQQERYKTRMKTAFLQREES